MKIRKLYRANWVVKKVDLVSIDKYDMFGISTSMIAYFETEKEAFDWMLDKMEQHYKIYKSIPKYMFYAGFCPSRGPFVEPRIICKESKKYVWSFVSANKALKSPKESPNGSYFDSCPKAWQWLEKQSKSNYTKAISDAKRNLKELKKIRFNLKPYWV